MLSQQSTLQRRDILTSLLFSVNDFYLDLLLDKPPATSRPLISIGRDEVELPHKLWQEFCHLEY